MNPIVNLHRIAPNSVGQYVYEEAKFNNKIYFNSTSCFIKHRVEKTLVGVPPDSCMLRIFFFKFIEIFDVD